MKIPSVTDAFAAEYLKPNTNDGSLVLFNSLDSKSLCVIDFDGKISKI